MLSSDLGLDRAAGREARRALWDRIPRLKRLKLVFGAGRNELAATKPSRQPARPRPRRQRRTAGRLPRAQAVSAVRPVDRVQQPETNYLLGAEVVQTYADSNCDGEKPPKTKSVITPQQASEAGRALARLPRKQPRQLTGFLHGQRCWRGRLLRLPDGEVVRLYWTSRGRVMLQDCTHLRFGSWLLSVARREAEVSLYRHPAAVALGGLKTGIKEAPSIAKASAARANGRSPVRAGRRPRGRPSRSTFFAR